MGPKRQRDGTLVYQPIGTELVRVGMDEIGVYIRVEAGTATIKGMVGASRSVYTRYKRRTCISGSGGGDGDIVILGRGRVEYRRMEGSTLKLI